MSNKLDQELGRGQLAAEGLVNHLSRMGATQCMRFVEGESVHYAVMVLPFKTQEEAASFFAGVVGNCAKFTTEDGKDKTVSYYKHSSK